MTENLNMSELEQRILELENKMHSVDAIAQDVMRCQVVEKELEQRLAFEVLLNTISTEFINLAAAEIDNEIERALKRVGDFLKADRCYLFQFNEEGNALIKTHEHVLGKVKPVLGSSETVKASALPWLINELNEKDFFHIQGGDDFPTQAINEKEKFLKDNIKVLAVYGIKINDRLNGFVGFDWLRQNEISKNAGASLLNLIGVIFANAIERKREEGYKDRLINELRDNQEELLTLSIRDQLTNLFNRRHMEESLGREIRRADRYKTSLTILMLDVDYFKQVNDIYGHMAGDLVLKEISKVLLNNSRGEDVVCRYGGEEFVIIMPGAHKKDGIIKAQKICNFVEEKLKVTYREELLPTITVSLGVASYPQDGENYESILYEADNALYKAKQTGRNKVVAA